MEQLQEVRPLTLLVLASSTAKGVVGAGERGVLTSGFRRDLDVGRSSVPGFRRDLDVGLSSIPDSAPVRYVGRGVVRCAGGWNRVPNLAPAAGVKLVLKYFFSTFCRS